MTPTSLFLSLAKALQTLEEVEKAELMVNMTSEAAEQAIMRAMEADEQARSANNRMEKLIEVRTLPNGAILTMVLVS